MDQYTSVDITKLTEEIAKQLTGTSSNVVKVTYAGTLTNEIKSDLEKGIRSRFLAAKDIIFENDNSLIGGFRVEYADIILDASVKEKLRTIINN